MTSPAPKQVVMLDYASRPRRPSVLRRIFKGDTPIHCASISLRLAARLIDGVIVTGLAVIYLVPGIIYFVARDTVGGASIGKRVCGLRVVNGDDNTTVNSAQALSRGFTQLIGCFTLGLWPVLDFVMALTRADRCTSIDLLTNSRVILASRARRPSIDPNQFYDDILDELIREHPGQIVVVCEDMAVCLFETYESAERFVVRHYPNKRVCIARVPNPLF